MTPEETTIVLNKVKALLEQIHANASALMTELTDLKKAVDVVDASDKDDLHRALGAVWDRASTIVNLIPEPEKEKVLEPPPRETKATEHHKTASHKK